jgi:hypothetical protein
VNAPHPAFFEQGLVLSTCLADSAMLLSLPPHFSEPTHDPREEAAGEAALAVALAVEEDGVASLVSELLGALEDVAGRALGAARLVGDYARATKHDLEDHVDDLLTVSADSLIWRIWQAGVNGETGRTGGVGVGVDRWRGFVKGGGCDCFVGCLLMAYCRGACCKS